MNDPQPAVSYVLDEGDSLVEVNDAWRAFAMDNDGAFLAEGVVGRWIWDLIQDEGMRLLFERLTGEVRATGAVLSYPFRCDGPRYKRHLDMVIERQGAGRVRLTGYTRRLEDYDPDQYWYFQVAQPVLRPICRHCGRVFLRDAWVSPRSAVTACELFASDHRVALSPTRCQTCGTDPVVA